METATLAGGCFWCLEAVYRELRGVESAVSGYMGGHVERPSYQEVCTGSTGHAESVQIVFDPAIVTYRDLLEVFFGIHNPTTLNRQGEDVGTQYRSAIFYHSEQQKATAEGLLQELATAGAYADPIVTQLVPASIFWSAEDYHQDYLRNHPFQPYCQFTVQPKVDKFRKRFAQLRKPV
jgi:peptide-methionine (S)-S-oxide reductase